MKNIYKIQENHRGIMDNNFENDFEEFRKLKNNEKKKKKGFDLYKKNTLNSLNEVENFLRDFNHFIKYVKLYKILR